MPPLRGLLDRLDYAAASVDDEASMAALAVKVEALRDGDVLYHMSTAPHFYGPACQALAAHGAGRRGHPRDAGEADRQGPGQLRSPSMTALPWSSTRNASSASTTTSARKACRT